MENKTRRNIEKICLAGLISGLSFLSIETALDYYQNKNNFAKDKSVTLKLLNAIGLTCVGYSLSLWKEKYYYKN